MRKRPALKVLLVLVAFAVGVCVSMLLSPADAPPEPAPAPARAPVVVLPVGPPPVLVADAGPAAPPKFSDGFCAGEDIPLAVGLRMDEGEPHSTIEQGDAGTALVRLTEASPLWAQLYLQARKSKGAAADRLAVLRRARSLAPHEPGLGLLFAWAGRDEPDLDEAIEGLSAALELYPLPELTRMKGRLEVARDIQRDYRRESRNGVTLLWPATSLTEAQAKVVLRDLDQSLDAAAAFTGTERRRALTVVVYPSRSELLAVGCLPTWAGGAYDGTLRLVASPTADGVQRAALRHETLHAQMDSQRAPLWFSEGVAQAFSLQPIPAKVWGLMVGNRTWIPFSSLDDTFSVFDGPADATLAYAQSFAMVELIRDCGGEGAIGRARGDLEAGLDTPTVLARVCARREVTGEDLLAFLARRLALK